MKTIQTLIAVSAAALALAIPTPAKSADPAQPFEGARVYHFRSQDHCRNGICIKKTKGCAKLEVTEPPRNFVPKKERET